MWNSTNVYTLNKNIDIIINTITVPVFENDIIRFPNILRQLICFKTNWKVIKLMINNVS